VGFAGVIELSLAGRGPRRGFLFDPHRLALPCWAELGARGALLVTFDRHFDLVPPRVECPTDLSPAAYDDLARTRLNERNVDHVFAAAEAGLISDVIAVARSWPDGASKEPGYRSRDGAEHAVVRAPTLERLLEDPSVLGRLEAATQIVLDFDLDCFVTPSDADPFTIVPWPRRLIREFLRPRGSERFWERLLARCIGLTFAREPNHCGGVVAGNQLFEKASRVIFEDLLEAQAP
jgi:hypothetical protein